MLNGGKPSRSHIIVYLRLFDGYKIVKWTEDWHFMAFCPTKRLLNQNHVETSKLIRSIFNCKQLNIWWILNTIYFDFIWEFASITLESAIFSNYFYVYTVSTDIPDINSA